MAQESEISTSNTVAPPPTAKIQVDTSGMTTAYSNFCRLTGGPDEVILDLGLNPHHSAQGPGTEPIRLNQRVVLNYVTAKQLAQLLHLTIQQHEKAYGPIELDYRKRVVRGEDQADA